MKKNILTLTIAIPAFNEELGIESLLKDVFSQRLTNIKLQEIIVLSDGSTDKTNEIVERLLAKNKKLKLLVGKKQMGKVARLNQIFQMNKSDFLLVLDADIGLVGDRFIQKMITVAKSDKKALMVVSHQIPLQPKDFIGKVLHASFMFWDYVRLSVPHKDHVQNFYGAATLYKDSFAKTLKIPKKATEERLYIYLMAKSKNGFRYAQKAVLLYWAIGTVDDYIKLSRRSFGTEQPALEKLFGEKIHTAYLIPRKYKIIGLLKSFYHQPLFTPLALIAGVTLARLTQKHANKTSALWEIVASTKKPITYNKIKI